MLIITPFWFAKQKNYHWKRGFQVEKIRMVISWFHCKLEMPVTMMDNTALKVLSKEDRMDDIKCPCLRKCSRGRNWWSTDLAETWHKSWV